MLSFFSSDHAIFGCDFLGGQFFLMCDAHTDYWIYHFALCDCDADTVKVNTGSLV